MPLMGIPGDVVLYNIRYLASHQKCYPIPQDEGFMYTSTKKIVESGYKVHHLPDQDYVHNIKKMVNVLLHGSRTLMCGVFLVHMNITCVIDRL